MKSLVKGFIKWLIIVLATLTLIVWVFIFTAFCQSVYDAAKPKTTQDVHPKHPSLEDFEDSIGYRIVTITSKDDRLIFYTKELKNRVYLGSFAYDKYTRFDDKKFEGCYNILYCKTHNFAYVVAPCKGD